MNIKRDHLCSCGQCRGEHAVGWPVSLSLEMPLEAQQGRCVFLQCTCLGALLKALEDCFLMG